MKIMVDLDRVVFDCPSFIFWIGNMIFTKSHLDKELQYHVVDKDKATNYCNNLFFLKMSHSKYFKQVDKSVEILRKWNQQGFEVHFVSSRPNFKAFQKATVDWLKENKINYSSLIFKCSNKPLYCLINKFDVIIDDTYKNCRDASLLGTSPIWMRTKYNQSMQNQHSIPDANNWTTIDNIVQSIYIANKSQNDVKTKSPM